MPERILRISNSRAVVEITVQTASYIQQSRYINHLKSRNRGAVTLLQVFMPVKKITSKEPSGKTGVQPVRGRQVRRGKWSIMILLEISQHAVVQNSPDRCEHFA